MKNFPVIPFKIDFWAVFIFLGVVQAIILSIFFLSKKDGKHPYNRLAGFILFSLSLMGFEILLFYTGYIQKLLFLVDFSEPLNFVVGPLFYLFVYFKVTGAKTFRPVQYFHFIPFVIYSLYAVFFLCRVRK